MQGEWPLGALTIGNPLARRKKKQTGNKGEGKREILRVSGVFIPTTSYREKSLVAIQMVDTSNDRWKKGPFKELPS